MNAKKHLMNARCRVLVKEPWYGVISSRFIWVESIDTKTMGVSIINMKVNCYYNPLWICTLDVDELVAVICHEIEHIIRMHIPRSKIIDDELNFDLFNVGCDWVINGYKHSKRIKNLPDCGCFIPHGSDQSKWKSDISVLKPDWTSEEFYEWLKQNCEELPINLTDDHDTWKLSNNTKDEIRQVARDLARSATQSVGKAPGNLIEYIDKLNEPEDNWGHKWKNIIGRVAGRKRFTYSKRNKRNDKFGVKGVSKRASIPIVVGVDVSGSITTRMIEKVFSNVDAMSSFFKITLIQFDSEVKSIRKYHKGDWSKIEILGRGGTSFNSFFNYIECNKCVGKMNVIVTDGFDYDIPSRKNYPVCWVVIGQEGIKFLNDNGLDWGERVLIPYDFE